MSLAVDRNKLKLKHFLNIQSECKDYPSDDDYIYELVYTLEMNEMIYEPFGTNYCKHNISAITDKSHEKHLEKLNSLTAQGYLEQVESGGVRNSRFKLVNHPWRVETV